MKKYFCLIVTLIMFTAVISCKADVDLSYYVSQLRENVYTCDVDGLKVTVYAEKRETPFIADSYVGKLKNQLIVKIDGQNATIDDAEILLSYDKTTALGSFTYSPIGGKYTSTIEVETLPKSASINGVLKTGGKEIEFVLTSAVVSGFISSSDALNAVKKHDSKIVEELFCDGKVQAEIHIRIMADGTRNYYYVGFVTKDSTYAYLVDGKTGEVLAKKSNPHI